MKINIHEPAFRAEAAAIDELIENVRRCQRLHDYGMNHLIQEDRQLRQAREALRRFCTPTREVAVVNGRIFL